VAVSSGNQVSDSNLLAVGDTEGMITIMQLCDNLFMPMDGEKEVIELSFNRESTREKNLEKARNLSKKPKDDKGDDAEDEEMRKRLEAIEKEFFEKTSVNQ
jgi:hypothetical protein